ncbi:MAG: ATP-binding protein [Planctomycetota bacterium]
MLTLPRSLWRRRVGTRVVAALLLCSLVLGAIASYVSYRSEEGAALGRLQRVGRTLARAAALACPDAILIEPPDYILLQTYVDQLTSSDAKVAFARIERGADGRVLARSPVEGPLPPSDSTLYVTEPIRIDRDGDELGRFAIGMSLEPMRADLRARAAGLFLQATLSCVLVALVLLLVLHRIVVRPLTVLDEHAQRLARGQLDAELPGLGDTELGRLARTMETMRQNLRDSHESLAAQNRQLRELDRLKSQFLANMSHEIRTPIHAILGSVDLMQDRDLGEGERAGYMKSLRWNANHLLDLVNTLLDLSKIESGNLIVESVPCRPMEVLEDAVACVRPLAEAKGLYLRLELAVGLKEWVGTDPMRLRQILMNVVGNAIKFTDRGGVRIRCAPAHHGQQALLEIQVVDTGPGMPREFLQRVFEPFTQADGSVTRRHGGTGLGLSIAREVARQLGGDIVADSAPGRGTTMTITVGAPDPKWTGPRPAEQAPQKAASALRFAGRVLLVDDSLDNQKLLSAMLRKAGVDVDVAENGRVAIERVQHGREQGSDYDLILMDVQMPEMDGLEATRWLRQHDVRRPIVALTAHALAEDRESCLQAGCDAYETKPISRARLLEVLGRHLQPAEGGAPPSPQASTAQGDPAAPAAPPRADD